ncbi:MAG TPA: hypothetical protein VKV74_05035 [Bryobacteraceae bacterium]|nr:hypothetical protein [Bryobacteraceae bacterium]
MNLAPSKHRGGWRNPRFERGVAMVSLDTEQIWGYRDPLFDPLDESQFENRYPGAPEAHDKLLACLQAAGIGATWFVVGGLALPGSAGACDGRLAGLPSRWKMRIPRGDEKSAPLWYRRSFLERLRAAGPLQEIGLHGGLTHFAWTDREENIEDVIRWELSEGLRALAEVELRPRSFSFPRDEEAHHALLTDYGICAYRGPTPGVASRLGRTLAGAVWRALAEIRRAAPTPVWPQETFPGLWNIPSSMFLYPIGPARSRIVGLRTRVERFARGIEAAVRRRGVFHFCLHPENLAESPSGFSMFEELLEKLLRARARGDVEVLTMREVAARMSAFGSPFTTHSQGSKSYVSHQ